MGRGGASSCARIAVVLAGALLSLPASVSAAVPDNDRFTRAAPLRFGEDVSASTVGATTEPGEPYTANGVGANTYCSAGSGKRTQQDRTLWWRIEGSGRPVTVSTAGSAEDTVLGAFGDAMSAPFACNDDEASGIGSTWQSKLTFDTVAGTAYHLQVGRCSKVISARPLHDCADQPGTGIRLRADTAPPPNDAHAAAMAIPTNTPVAGDNYGAGEQPGEVLTCPQAGGAPYGRTVWYRWSAPAPGRAEFISENPVKTVVAVSQGGQALGCSGGDASGRSSLALDVRPGEYLLQVGGHGVHDPARLADSSSGRLLVRVQFSENLDRDGDGAPNAVDCAADDPTRHPRAVDEPQDGIDQDCDGRDAPFLSIPTTARMSFVGAAATLVLRRLPRGGRVTVRCTRCSRPLIRRPVANRSRRLVLRAAALGRWRRGAVIRVDVTAPRQVGARWKWRMRSTPRPAGECALTPGAKPTC